MAKDQNFQVLLDAENEAEEIIEEARNFRETLLKDTLEETHQQEARFESRIPEIRESSLRRAVQHAEQVISDHKNRYEERCSQLCDLSDQRKDEALEASFELFINSKD